ncbi:hypothetical protein [Paenibacillus contaminans]|nr:hypothetical protein [Paenibacillus contaminans]
MNFYANWPSIPQYRPPYYSSDEFYPYAYQAPFIQPAAPFVRNEADAPQLSDSRQTEDELNQTFRTLWEQHVAWTRMLIISIASGLPDEAAVTERLLRNAPDMAAVFRRYYGGRVASEFNRLFTEHLVLAAQLVKAAKAGNSKAVAEAERKWYANADEIAAFLSRINPNWPKPVLQKMLHEHLRLTKAEAVQRLSQNYKADIATYDQIEKQALEMADAFTEGIVKQFPHKFKK